MKKGFTLIELLAVIVILAIIATIAAPIVISIIRDSREGALFRSAEFYIDAVEQAIVNKKVNIGGNFTSNLCEIKENGNLLCDEKILEIELDGNVPNDGRIILDKGKISKIELIYNKKYIVWNSKKELAYSPCRVVEDSGEIGITKGDKYLCNVEKTMETSKEDGYYFYVLSINEDGTTNLIMDRNSVLQNGNEKGHVNWNSENDTTAGPINAMNYLYEATKNWDNIPNIIMNYTDEGNKANCGYGSIKTNGLVTKMTKKDETTVIATYENLKARLPYASEVGKSDGTNEFLYENLHETTTWYGEGQQPTNTMNRVGGYWTLSSVKSNCAKVLRVYYDGRVGNADAKTDTFFGVRPVITVEI